MACSCSAGGTGSSTTSPANAGAVPGAEDLSDVNTNCGNNQWFGNTWTAFTYPGLRSLRRVLPGVHWARWYRSEAGLESAL